MNKELHVHVCNNVTNQAKSWHSKRKTIYIVIWIMVIREINNKNWEK